MTEITNQLIYEVLKQIQTEVADVKKVQADHTQQLLRIRDDINNVRDEINNLRKDDLRIEVMLSNLEVRIERIERRLNLTDA